MEADASTRTKTLQTEYYQAFEVLRDDFREFLESRRYIDGGKSKRFFTDDDIEAALSNLLVLKNMMNPFNQHYKKREWIFENVGKSVLKILFDGWDRGESHSIENNIVTSQLMEIIEGFLDTWEGRHKEYVENEKRMFVYSIGHGISKGISNAIDKLRRKS